VSFVYLVTGDGGLVKVGVSADPHQRLLTLQTGFPGELLLSDVWHCGELARTVERLVHADLAPWRVSGEWFRVDRSTAELSIERARRMAGPLAFPHRHQRRDGSATAYARAARFRDDPVGDVARAYLFYLDHVLVVCRAADEFDSAQLPDVLRRACLFDHLARGFSYSLPFEAGEAIHEFIASGRAHG
jgi:hypothetical protein